MKVAVYQGMGPPEVGGGYRLPREVAEALLAADGARHEFRIIVTSGPSVDFLEAPVDRILDLRRTGAARASQRLRRLIAPGAWERFREGRWWSGSRSFEPYLVEQLDRHGIGALLSLVPLAIPTLRIPVVTVVWDLQHRLQPIFPEVSSGGEWERRESSYRRLLPRAAAVVTGTKRGREEISQFYGVPRESVFVVPMPTPEFARRAGATGPGLGTGRPPGLPEKYLIYPAQFWPHKNHVVLLQALRLLRERGHGSLGLVLAGSNWGGGRLHVEEAARDLGLTDSVIFAGFVEQERLVALYRHAEALVFPSYFGPDNIPPLEAFAIGTPVVAARVPGAEEQLGDAALLADPRIPEEWANALSLLLENVDLRRSLVEKGRERAATRTVAHYVEGLCEVFDRIAPLRDCWPLGTAAVPTPGGDR